MHTTFETQCVLDVASLFSNLCFILNTSDVITGGFELALACDILVGNETTTFRDTHVKFGLAPCWGLSQKLQRRIGPGRAKLGSALR